jgi:Kef-type K+ transport system membrane component KefB
MTARVLADLGRLQDDAAKVVLGAPRRGGLIFAGAGLAAGVIAEDLYSGLIVVVMLTTFVAPPWLKTLYRT